MSGSTDGTTIAVPQAAARRFGPWSLRAKVLGVAFVATHVPLLATVGFLLFGPPQPSRGLVFSVVLLATAAGTGIVLWALSRLLRPLLLASDALHAFVSGGVSPVLPEARDGDGEIGILLDRLSAAVGHVQRRTERLEAQAHQDFLTGLLNRRAAQMQLRHSLAIAQRTGIPLTLALMDIDGFKRINDSLGHADGDRVLRSLAAMLRQHARRTTDWAARWGGDELLLVLYTDAANASALLERLRVEVQDDRSTAGGSPVTISVGATLARPGDTQEALLARADAALYRAKASGRNRVEME